METMEKSIANFLKDLFVVEATKRRTGIIDNDLFIPLKKYALNQLNKPFDELAKESFLCFCFPDKPLVYPKEANEAKNLWDNGATMNIQNLELNSEFYNIVCNSLSELLNYKVTCSMYISKPNAHAFSYHTDEWVGLAIQIQGDKSFLLLEKKSPQRIKMEEGNWLRLDPSDVHKAETETLSVHLNFAVHKKHRHG